MKTIEEVKSFIFKNLYDLQVRINLIDEVIDPKASTEVIRLHSVMQTYKRVFYFINGKSKKRCEMHTYVVPKEGFTPKTLSLAKCVHCGTVGEGSPSIDAYFIVGK